LIEGPLSCRYSQKKRARTLVRAPAVMAKDSSLLLDNVRIYPPETIRGVPTVKRRLERRKHYISGAWRQQMKSAPQHSLQGKSAPNHCSGDNCVYCIDGENPGTGVRN
jgi:hypothetical protein